MAGLRQILGYGVSAALASVLLALLAFGAAQKIAARQSAPARGAVSVPAAVAPPAPPAAPQPADVKLFFAGDVMLDRNVAARIAKAKDDLYPFRAISGNIRFTEADRRVINVEGPVTNRRRPPEKSIDFMFAPQFAGVLRQAGFDIASQANNHALDQGRAGAEDSRTRLSAAGLLVFGDESRDGDEALATTTVREQRLAFVGFSEVSDSLDETAAEKVIKRARGEAETVIAYMHWGEEYRNRPTKAQEARARWLINHGVDVVIGGHPHWVQGISSYKGKPIVYSLGNFVFDQDWSAETNQGLAVTLKISTGGYTLDLHPVQIMQSRPRFLEGAELKKRLASLSAVSDPSLREQVAAGRIFFPAP